MKILHETHGRNFSIYHGDSTEVLRPGPGWLAENSVGYSIYSPPFSDIFCYSSSERDAGNSKDNGQFFEHYRFILENIYRLLKPGRNMSVHCMDLPTLKMKTGSIGLSDFSGDIIRLCQEVGFIYHTRVTITKSPVLQMQRTKALGLLYKTLLGDSSMSRMGLADYLLTFRKPGQNKEPITHTKETFSLDQWQKWASPVWDDIDEGDTLQYRSARENEDEKHLAVLQQDVVRRGILLWSNPGDVVASAFGGIGTEGVVALELGRKALLCELKGSYYRQAAANLLAAEKEPAQRSLFDAGLHLPVPRHRGVIGGHGRHGQPGES